MLQPLLGRWDKEGEEGEGGEMRMEQGPELRPCNDPGVKLRMRMNVCMEIEGNGEGVSPEKNWVIRLCKSVRARWAQRLQWVERYMSGVCCCVNVVNCVMNVL